MLSKLVTLVSLCVVVVAGMDARAQKLSPKWEELTGPDFVRAIRQSEGVCLLPFGIIEKHGAHLPLGTDLLDVRFAAMNATEKEYAVVFPEYYFGQIFEAQQQPGTLAYSLQTQLTLLQETVKEVARNRCKKVVIVNGHGGNESLLPLFAQAQLGGITWCICLGFRVETVWGGRHKRQRRTCMGARRRRRRCWLRDRTWCTWNARGANRVLTRTD